MKHPISLIALIIVILSLSYYRVSSLKLDVDEPFVVTKWDTYGYYLYLPGLFIYKDIDRLQWHDKVEKEYHLMGDRFYQMRSIENGKKVGKYTIGTAILQAPFFFIGHQIALQSHYKADGFSPPYQYALSIGLVLYIIIAFGLLRWLLLKYFSDLTVALTIVLLLLASNLIQYTAIEPVQVHAPLFLMYVLLLVFTYKWHIKPRFIWAALIGFVIGLTTIMRPTELIMILIPILWNTHTKKDAHFKWLLVRSNLLQLFLLVVITFLAALPQIIYWKYVTGHFIYQMASAWDFLTPHFRVLFGFEKGWFIYTPITIFFIWGMFKLKGFPFRKAVIWFCLINIYIIIAWRDWHYGGSYSTRALTQSYPVFAFAFAAFIESLKKRHWKIGFYILASYLVFVNLFQIYQYNHWILHYNQMNFSYYKRIYLTKSINALDVSFMDTNEDLRNKESYRQQEICALGDSNFESKSDILFIPLDEKVEYLEFKCKIRFDNGFENSQLNIKHGKKQVSFRSHHPLSSNGIFNLYHFYFKIEENRSLTPLVFKILNPDYASGDIQDLKIVGYSKKEL